MLYDFIPITHFERQSEEWTIKPIKWMCLVISQLKHEHEYMVLKKDLYKYCNKLDIVYNYKQDLSQWMVIRPTRMIQELRNNIHFNDYIEITLVPTVNFLLDIGPYFGISSKPLCLFMPLWLFYAFVAILCLCCYFIPLWPFYW